MVKLITLLLLISNTLVIKCEAGASFTRLSDSIDIINLYSRISPSKPDLIMSLEKIDKLVLSRVPFEITARKAQEQWEAYQKAVEMIDSLHIDTSIMNELMARHLIHRIDKEYKSSSTVLEDVILDIKDSLHVIAESKAEYREKEIVLLSKIVEQIRKAKEASQKAISKEELDRLLEAAKNTNFNQARMIIDNIKGTMVYVGSITIQGEDYAKRN